MAFRGNDLKRFLYSHYFLGGVRQAVGVLAPAVLLGGLFELYAIGAIASIGAACVAILDQPGGPRRYGTNGMLGAILLGSLTAALTGLATTHTAALWVVVPLLCFIFSMFTVFGKQGGLLGYACLLLMTLTMREPLAAHEVLLHTTYSFLGGLFYFAYSYCLHRLLWHRESMQALSVALFATADYIRVRSTFYDMDVELEDSYRTLISRQADMTEKHQATRDLVLREAPRGKPRSRPRKRTTRRCAGNFLTVMSCCSAATLCTRCHAMLNRSPKMSLATGRRRGSEASKPKYGPSNTSWKSTNAQVWPKANPRSMLCSFKFCAVYAMERASSPVWACTPARNPTYY